MRVKAYANRFLREDLSEEVTFKPGKAFQTKGPTQANALRQEGAWLLRGHQRGLWS